MSQIECEEESPIDAYLTLVSRDYCYATISESYSSVMGFGKSVTAGTSLQEIWGKERFETDLRPLFDRCFDGTDVHCIDRVVVESGFRHVQTSLYPYRENGQIRYVMLFAHDVSIVKHLESKLMDYEFKDPVTGLLNRKSFDIVLDKEIERAKRTPEYCFRAVLLVNLRNFSQINARYGYEIGDLLFESTALRVREAIRSSDYVFRYEGKELAIILTTLKNPVDTAVVAETIHARVTFPYDHHGSTINVGCNIGIATFPDDSTDREDLVRFAASAMDEAASQDVPYIIFNHRLHLSALRKTKLRSEMRKALVDRHFETHYQPIVDKAGRLVGAEALVRWKHPALGYVSPAEFIPIAEDAGYTIMIGRWMLYRVCRFLHQHARDLAGRYVSVNLSAKEFGGRGLVEYIRTVLQNEMVNPATLKLEITETESLVDIEDAITKISQLKKIGVDVYVDDFGAGYSSLAYLKRLPAAIVKIDRLFVETLGQDAEDKAFVSGMIDMIVAKRMKVLMEGVSTSEQYEAIKTMNADYLQGYYFSVPVPEQEYLRLAVLNKALPLD